MATTEQTMWDAIHELGLTDALTVTRHGQRAALIAQLRMRIAELKVPAPLPQPEPKRPALGVSNDALSRLAAGYADALNALVDRIDVLERQMSRGIDRVEALERRYPPRAELTAHMVGPIAELRRR